MAKQETGINPAQYQEAIKRVDQLYKRQKDLNKMTDTYKSVWEGISATIFGVSGADWWDKVPKTTEDLVKQAKMLDQMNSHLDDIGDNLNKKLSVSIKAMGEGLEKNLEGFISSFRSKTEIISSSFKGVSENLTFTEQQDMIDLLTEKSKKFSDMSETNKNKLSKLIEKTKLQEDDIAKVLEKSHTDSDKFYEKLKKELPEINKIKDEGLQTDLLMALASKDIAKFLDKHGDKGIEVLSLNKDIFESIQQEVEEYKKANFEVKKMTEELAKPDKEVFKIGRGLTAIAKNIASGIIPKMLEFDKIIHDTQKTTGIMFTENAARMTELTVKTAKFGMSIEDTAAFMGTLGEELRTIDFNVLSQATDDLKAIQLATGMSAESMGVMAGEMMRMGDSSETVRDAMSDANVMAKRFGVSSKKVLEGISRNITKMRTMGFQGGEKSLMKMVATAERLRMNVDEIFDVADKARNIEGAMQMAAELQLAGGSFANINPMDLLASARKDPAALQKILTTMGKDIGNFVKNANGEMEYVFDAVDKDRLQIVADATGQTLDSIQKGIQKNAEDAKKMNLMPDITFEGLKDKDGKAIDPDSIKNTLMDSVDMTGKVLEGSVLDKAGIKNLGEITQEQAKKIMQDQIEKDKNLEKQAKQNQGFQDALTAFKNTFMNLLTVFEPVIEALTSAIQWLIDNKWALFTVAIIAMAAKLPALIAGMGKMAGGLADVGTKFGSMFKKGGVKDLFKGGMRPAISGTEGAGKDALATKVTKTEDLSKGVKGPRGKSGLETLAKGLKAMGGKGVMKGILATALAGPALLLFLPAVPGLLVLAGVGAVEKLVVAGFRAIAKGFGVMGRNFKDILLGSAAMALVGVSLGVFALAVGMFATIEWETLAKAGVALIGLVGALTIVGLLMSGPGGLALVVGAAALIVVAASLAIASLGLMAFAASMTLLSGVEWSVLGMMGTTLLGLVGPLLAFSLAGLMFANPITMFGMMLMVGTLASISAVLIPLSEALDIGGKGLDAMSSGVLTLSDALSKLDFEKLDKVKEFSQAMAVASLAGGAMSSMVAVIEAIGKIGGGKEEGGKPREDRNIVIQLKMPSGRVLEEHIVRDIDKVS